MFHVSCFMNHAKQWDFLKGKFEAGQLSHAYIFSGQDVDGLKSFAKDLVKLVNDKSIAGSLPNRQASDIAIESERYPDLLVVKSQNSKSSLKDKEDKLEIDVSQIRAAQEFLNLKSYYGGYKTVIIENAERMNNEAQSCFLKTLEEPKGKTMIILVSRRPDALMDTIFSRCQQIKFFGKIGPKILTGQGNTLNSLKDIIKLDLAEKFLYAKNVNMENGNLEKILMVFESFFREILLAKVGIEASRVEPEFMEMYDIFRLRNILRKIEHVSYKF